MKSKLIYIVIFSVFLGVSFMNAQNKITLEGGYFNPKRVGAQTSETYFDAIRIGSLYEYNLKYNFALQSGLLYNIGYSSKTQKYLTDNVMYKTWSHAWEIPVRVVYNQPLFKDFKVFGFAGPNLQIGFIQNQKIISNLNSTLETMTGIQSGNFNLYKNDLNIINFQLGAGGGVQWRQFILKSGYDWGLNNLDKTKKDKVYQGQWYVSFGYQIK